MNVSMMMESEEGGMTMTEVARRGITWMIAEWDLMAAAVARRPHEYAQEARFRTESSIQMTLGLVQCVTV